MNRLASAHDDLSLTALAPWASSLCDHARAAMDERANGDLARWTALLDSLPVVQPSSVELNERVMRVGVPGDCSDSARARIEGVFRELHPWRKGPFDIFGVQIETEWRSDWKWDRLAPHIEPLADRLVLDVGCGSGYHMWRMYGAGAGMVIGVDPYQLFWMQFLATKHFVGDVPVHYLPAKLEMLPSQMQVFDTVFSMGVLYHRRSPFDHLFELRQCLRPGGELVLETLVIDGARGDVLVPEGRYAQMGNVWFIPSPETLRSWLVRAGFVDVRLIDVSPTTVGEQRTTDWMQFKSLSDFLDPEDASRTLEGHPAPKRAMFLARS